MSSFLNKNRFMNKCSLSICAKATKMPACIMGIVFFFSFFSCTEDKTYISKLIDSAKKGDIYEMRVTFRPPDIYDKSMEGKQFYSLSKIDSIDSNMIYLKKSKYITDNREEFEKLKLIDHRIMFDSKVRDVRSISNLKVMLANGEILKIKRIKS